MGFFGLVFCQLYETFPNMFNLLYRILISPYAFISTHEDYMDYMFLLLNYLPSLLKIWGKSGSCWKPTAGTCL